MTVQIRVSIDSLMADQNGFTSYTILCNFSVAITDPEMNPRGMGSYDFKHKKL